MESVLYSFEGIDNSGGGAVGVLVQDAKGNLYATATPVAVNFRQLQLRLAGTWTETTLYNFGNWEGPGGIVAGLTPRSSGNTLFGVTMGGGNCNKHQCNGTVFKVTP